MSETKELVFEPKSATLRTKGYAAMAEAPVPFDFERRTTKPHPWPVQ